MRCNICDTPLLEPIYETSEGRALTSLCEIREGNVRVWSCPTCSHLCGEPFEDTQAYYETDYKILLGHEDEDQIYDVDGDRIIYRTEHQINTLLHKVELGAGVKLLDYGCAKASMPRRLQALRNDLDVYLFDVSAMYQEHWDRFVKPGHAAIHQTPPQWDSQFDVVTSFFALEHIPSPRDTVRHIANLLRPDGVLYGIVPDTFGNVADFVVIDHVNHFTAASLHTLLREAGFSGISIDDGAHRGALVFKASKTGAPTACPDIIATRLRSERLAAYWSHLSQGIRKAEREYGNLPCAIYGSGFYGAYISSVLQHSERVQCFLDASPYQQGKALFGAPIVAPEKMPESIKLLYVGLNPLIAHNAIEKMDWLRSRQVSLVFLDPAPHD